MNRRPWSEKEIEYLKANYRNTLSSEIATALNKPLCSVYGKANQLKLEKAQYPFNKGKKAETYMTPEGLARSKQNSFHKGHVPLNKGLKQTEYMSADQIAKTVNTRFTKGHEPKNTLHDGAITYRPDKNGHNYYYIRIAKNKWIMLHVHNWEMAFGKVPAGYIVVFKTGDHKNCNVENLELITRKENMQRNTIHNYPEPVRKAIRLKGKIDKKLKSHEQNRRSEQGVI
jgi:hypothetical protein